MKKMGITNMSAFCEVIVNALDKLNCILIIGIVKK